MFWLIFWLVLLCLPSTYPPILTVFLTSKYSFPTILTPPEPHSSDLGLEKWRRLYISADWTQPKYYETVKAVRVGHKLVHLTRGPGGILISVFDTSLQRWVSSSEFAWLTDAADWYVEKGYQTICVAELNSKMYVYARATVGSRLSAYDPDTNTLGPATGSSYLSDADGFSTPAYYRTIRMAAIGSRLYISARSNLGVHMASYNPSTNTWITLPTLNDFTDDSIWAVFGKYITLRMVAQGNSLWFFIRGPTGFYLFSFNTITTSWSAPFFKLGVYDDAGWDQNRYFETLSMVATSNGVYVTGKAGDFILTYLYNTSTGTLQVTQNLDYYKDADGWTAAPYYNTLRFVTCGADSVIVLGREATIITIFLLNTPTSASWVTGSTQPSFTDATGWNLIYRYWTLNAVCVNNSVYFVGRNLDNLEMIKYTISSDSWSVIGGITSKTCSATCQMCADTTISGCTSCYIHAHLASLSPSSCACDTSYFPDPGVYHCTACHPACLECTGTLNTHCIACFPNAQLVFPPISDCRCNFGFFLNSIKSCLPCVPHCLQCTGPGSNDCYQCEENAVLLANSCQCIESYYLSTAGTCQSCPSSCKTCSNGLNCLSCFSGAQISALVCECSLGYFAQPDASNCVPCLALCVSCKSTTKCDKCGSNADLVKGQCNCNPGFYASSGVIDCQSCSQGCISCSAEICEKCLENWYLFEGNCVQTCPVDMVMQEGSCVETVLESFLDVYINNTLGLSFSKPLTKVIEIGDINIQVTSLESSYEPVWTLTSLENLTSYIINLSFPDSTPTSNSTATLTFLDPSSLHDFTGNSLTTLTLSAPLYSFPSSPASIDPLASPTAQAAAAASQGAVAGGVVSSFFGGSPVGMFSLLNQLQLITYITFMNVTLPKNLEETLKGLQLESMFTTLFTYVYDENEGKIPPDFARNSGFTSTIFLLNANNLVLACISIILGYLFFSLFSHIPYFTAVQIYCKEYKEEYYWSIPLRLWIQLYLDIGVAGLLQFYDFSWTQYGGVVNGLVGGLCMSGFALTPVVLLLFLIVHAEEMIYRTDPTFNKRWGTLFLEFRQANNFTLIVFYPFFLIRRCIFAFILICLNDYPHIQFIYSIFSSLIVRTIQVLVYLLLYAPYPGRVAQWTAVLGETVTLACFSITTLFLGIEAKSSSGEILGLLMKWVIFVGIGMNTVISLVGMTVSWVKLVIRYKNILVDVKMQRFSALGPIVKIL